MFIQSAAASTLLTPSYYYGQDLDWGVVFWTNGAEALAVAKTDAGPFSYWGPLGSGGHIFGDGVGTGYTNWQWINDNLDITEALLLATNFNAGGYTDWYIPSVDEMTLIDGLYEAGRIDLLPGRYWTTSNSGCTTGGCGVDTCMKVLFPAAVPPDTLCYRRNADSAYTRCIRRL